MFRKNNTISFTEEDKKKLSIRTFSPEENNKNIKEIKRKKQKQRFLFFTSFIIGLISTWLYSDTDTIIIIAIFPLITGFIWIINEFIWFANRNYDTSVYYIEFQIKEKLPTEQYTNQSVTTGATTTIYYPIIGVDTNTGYKTKIYVDNWQTHNKEIGSIIKYKIVTPNEFLQQN